MVTTVLTFNICSEHGMTQRRPANYEDHIYLTFIPSVLQQVPSTEKFVDSS